MGYYLRYFIRLILPLYLRKRIKDLIEDIKRYMPGKPSGLLKYDLITTQIYPSGNNFSKVLTIAMKKKLAKLELNPTTPLASIGTCFAEEFAFFMMQNGYNYIRTENDALAASANWGRVYTIPNLLQIIRYSVDSTFPVVLEEIPDGWFDPLRETQIPYSLDKSIAQEELIKHREASLKAFSLSEILIITVGQNESWVDKSNDMIWGRIPPETILQSRKKDFVVKEFSYEDNLSALFESIEFLRKINPDLKIVFTVSPVASYASFSDTDVISNSFSNKCLLRAVVNKVVSSHLENLFYFPSFEMVLCDNPHSFRADNRHVKYSAVNRIFSLLVNSTSSQE